MPVRFAHPCGRRLGLSRGCLRGFAHGVSTLSCLQAVHEVCVDRGSLWSYRVRCDVQVGGGLVGLVTPLFLFLALRGRPRADLQLGIPIGIPGCSGVTYVGRPCVSELSFGQGYLISPFHLLLSPSGDPRWFQYGGLFNFVAPGGRRAQRGVGANWLVLGSRGYIRRALLLLPLRTLI